MLLLTNVLSFMWSFPRISVTIKTVLLVLLLFLLLNDSSSSSNDSPDLNRILHPGFCDDPCVRGTEEIMSMKEHGSSHSPVQSNLRWGQTWSIADRLCNFNRNEMEFAGYWETTHFMAEIDGSSPIEFYDSNTGKLLFTAPLDRKWHEFLEESRKHGWLSFRDDEVNWDNVRVLTDGEIVSIDGTHLGENKPDSQGRRYQINMAAVSGLPGVEQPDL